MQELVKCIQQAEVNAGATGELAARLLFILGYDFAQINRSSIHENYLYSSLLPLPLFFKSLLNLSQDQTNMLDEKWKKSFVCFTHFIPLTSVATTSTLRELFNRCAANC